MNQNTEEILKIVSDWKGSFCGAYSIRENGQSISRMSSEHIHIEPKKDKPGLDIHVDDGTKGETLAIPACVTVPGLDDVVYNDFFIGKDCDIKIIAGCGVHNDTGEPARHNGIHRFVIDEGSHVLYEEKHIGLGKGIGRKTAGLKLVLGKDGWLALFLVAQLGHDTGKLFIVPFAICGCVRYCQREHWFKASAKLREKIPCQRTLRLACMGHGG